MNDFLGLKATVSGSNVDLKNSKLGWFLCGYAKKSLRYVISINFLKKMNVFKESDYVSIKQE